MKDVSQQWGSGALCGFKNQRGEHGLSHRQNGQQRKNSRPVKPIEISDLSGEQTLPNVRI